MRKVFWFSLIAIFSIWLSWRLSSKSEVSNQSSRQEMIDTSQIEATLTADKSADKQTATVTKVIDGDSFVIDTGEQVRYIGIDTPEFGDGQPECFAQEAKTKNKSLIAGKTVELISDTTDRDAYGRLLRYVYVDGIFMNAILVREGYAYARAYYPNILHQSELLDLQRDAFASESGLWSTCEPKVFTTEIIDPICDHNAYVCSDFLYHEHAQAVFEACGGKSNDVHKFDADHDGIGCEILR